MEIYLDLVFLENFLMDFILLLMVGKMIHKTICLPRLLAAAFLGGISAAVLCLLHPQFVPGVQHDRRIVYAASELSVKASGISACTFVFVWKRVCTGRNASISGTVYRKQRTAQAVFPSGNRTFWLVVFSLFMEADPKAEAERRAAFAGHDPLGRKADRLHRTAGYRQCTQGANDRKTGHDRGADAFYRT